MSIDTTAFLAILSFSVQIMAGVAPMRWPQHAWLAGVIFWLALAFALGCSGWWILSNREMAMAVIKSGYSVAALLVARQPPIGRVARADSRLSCVSTAALLAVPPWPSG